MRRVPFHQTATASVQRTYRNLIKANLRCGEQVVMGKLLNLWFRHSHKGGPLALGNAEIARRAEMTERQVSRVVKSLIRRGFLRLAFGGVGRGRVRRFAVDLTAIREAFAPGMLAPVKGDISTPSHIAKGKVGTGWVWFCGLWGRSDDFRRRFANALAADARATWRGFIETKAKHGIRQHFGNSPLGLVEAGI